MARTVEVYYPNIKKKAAAKAAPTAEQIQLRAYQIFLERRDAPGNEVEDWLRAERELSQDGALKARSSTSSAKPKAA